MSADSPLKFFDLKTLKNINAGLASSAQQSLRDKSLDRLAEMLKDKVWFQDEPKSAKPLKGEGPVSTPSSVKCMRRLWEGLFFSK